MIAPFDIFRQEKDGSVPWIGVGATFEEAEQKVADADKVIPPTYMIVCITTGNKKIVQSRKPTTGA